MGVAGFSWPESLAVRIDRRIITTVLQVELVLKEFTWIMGTLGTEEFSKIRIGPLELLLARMNCRGIQAACTVNDMRWKIFPLINIIHNNRE